VNKSTLDGPFIFPILGPALLWLACTAALPAAVESVTLHVEGMASPFCAYGIEKQLKQLEAIGADYETDIEDGTITVGWVAAEPLDPPALERAMQDAGFSVAGIDATITGRPRREDADGAAAWFMKLEQPEQRIYLFGEEVDATRERQAQRLQTAVDASGRVRVRGRLHAHRDGPIGLRVEAVESIESIEADDTDGDTQAEHDGE